MKTYVAHVLALSMIAACGDRPASRDAASLPAVRIAGPPAGAAKDAIERWSREAERRPTDAAAWIRLGDAQMQKARETHDTAYYGRAEQAYSRAAGLDAKDVQALVGLAWVYGSRHEFERSVEWATKALAQDPRQAAAHGLIGDAELEIGEYDTAAEHYQAMLDRRPDLSSYGRVAHYLFVTGGVQQARVLMQKAIDSGGPYAENTAWCHAQLALMDLATGNLLAAQQRLTTALERSPNDYQLLAAMGRVETARHDWPAAIAAYRKAAAVAPQHEVVAALADLYRITGQPAQAAEQDALIEAIHRLNQANGVRGDIQLAQFWADHEQHLPEALALAEEEYRTRRNVVAADVLAWCYYRNGRLQDAKRMIARALEWHTPDALFYFHAGMIHAKLGDRATAERYLYQALSLNPNFHPLYADQASATLQELGSQPATGSPAS